MWRTLKKRKREREIWSPNERPRRLVRSLSFNRYAVSLKESGWGESCTWSCDILQDLTSIRGDTTLDTTPSPSQCLFFLSLLQEPHNMPTRERKGRVKGRTGERHLLISNLFFLLIILVSPPRLPPPCIYLHLFLKLRMPICAHTAFQFGAHVISLPQ